MESSRLDCPVTDQEYEQARTSLEGVGWAAKQSQPHCAFDASTLLSELPKRRRETLKKIDKAVRPLQERPIKNRFPAGLDMSKVGVLAFSDASWGNRSDGTSQGGYILGLTDEDGLAGREAPFSITMWSSHKVRRMCRPTLPAGSQAACIAVENGDFLRTLLLETLNPPFVSHVYTEHSSSIPSAVITDAKSVYDHVTSDNGRHPGDKRLAIDLRILQGYIQKGGWQVKWVSGPQMLSDVLTKGGADSSYLAWALEKGRCELTLDDHLQGKVAGCLRSWEEQVAQKSIDDLEHEAKGMTTRQKRMQRRSDSNRRRKAAVLRLTTEGAGEGDSQILRDQGCAKGLICALRSLRRASYGLADPPRKFVENIQRLKADIQRSRFERRQHGRMARRA